MLNDLLPWEFSPAVLLACVVPALLYWRGLRRLRAQGEAPGVWRGLSFFTGLALFYGVTQTHYDYLSQHMFWVHRLQHLVLHHIAPFLVVLAAPGAALAAGTPGPVRTRLRALGRTRLAHLAYYSVQNVVVAPLLFLGLIFFWLSPEIHFDAMLSPWLYQVMNWSMAIDGLLFWWFLFDPRSHVGYGVRMGIAVGIMFPQILLGAYIALTRHELYDVYAVCGRAWPVSPMEDQDIGGLITWVPAAMMSVLASLLMLRRALYQSEADEVARLAASEGGGP